MSFGLKFKGQLLKNHFWDIILKYFFRIRLDKVNLSELISFKWSTVMLILRARQSFKIEIVDLRGLRADRKSISVFWGCLKIIQLFLTINFSQARPSQSSKVQRGYFLRLLKQFLQKASFEKNCCNVKIVQFASPHTIFRWFAA